MSAGILEKNLDIHQGWGYPEGPSLQIIRYPEGACQGVPPDNLLFGGTMSREALQIICYSEGPHFYFLAKHFSSVKLSVSKKIMELYSSWLCFIFTLYWNSKCRIFNIPRNDRAAGRTPNNTRPSICAIIQMSFTP